MIALAGQPLPVLAHSCSGNGMGYSGITAKQEPTVNTKYDRVVATLAEGPFAGVYEAKFVQVAQI